MQAFWLSACSEKFIACFSVVFDGLCWSLVACENITRFHCVCTLTKQYMPSYRTHWSLYCHISFSSSWKFSCKAMEIAEFHSSRCSHLERSWLWSPKAELGIRKNGLGIKRSSLHTYHLLRSCGLVASFTSCSGKIYSTDTTDEHFDAMQDWYDSYSQANTYKSSTDELLAAVMKQSVANI